MPKPKVFVTRKFPGPGIAMLQKHCMVKVYPKDAVLPRSELVRGVTWCDALLCLLTDNINKELIDANPNLKIISNYAIGYNNIDLKYATGKKIPVTNTPGRAITDAVAEHALALMFAITKRIHEADQFTRQGKYTAWSPSLLLGMELVGKTLGIVGLGRIGAGVAERAGRGMGMNIIYYDIKPSAEFEKRYHAQLVSLAELVQTADIITIHVPLLPSTHHLIGRKELAFESAITNLCSASTHSRRSLCWGA